MPRRETEGGERGQWRSRRASDGARGVSRPLLYLCGPHFPRTLLLCVNVYLLRDKSALRFRCCNSVGGCQSPSMRKRFPWRQTRCMMVNPMRYASRNLPPRWSANNIPENSKQKTKTSLRTDDYIGAGSLRLRGRSRRTFQMTGLRDGVSCAGGWGCF